MQGRTPAAAVNALKDQLQRAVSCVTDAVLVLSAGAYQANSVNHTVRFAGGPVRIADTLLVWIDYQYRLIHESADREPWHTVQTAYHYVLYGDDGREIIAYHWHPHVEGMTYPHLHVSLGAVRSDVIERAGLSGQANALRPDLAGAHLPTGPIAAERVLWLAIAQFGVAPLRRDWRRLLPAPS